MIIPEIDGVGGVTTFCGKAPFALYNKSGKEILPHKELEGTVLDDYP